MNHSPDAQKDASDNTPTEAKEVMHLRDLSPQQWKSGIAAWLGWLFDGLDMHLYLLVAAPFVAQLLMVESEKHPDVAFYSSWIQAAFLFGWALGGGFFGRISDRIGRSRALMLTILTYALFTGLSYFAQTWWQLLIFRFLAALGIGGEWAVGASLLSETWPKRWRPWMAAVLQSAVNLGVMLACLAVYLMADLPERCVFLVGVIPALLVLWIRRAVPEPEVWDKAIHQSGEARPGFADLFRGAVRRTTILTILVCSLSLTAHWAFMFWFQKHVRNHKDLNGWATEDVTRLATTMFFFVMVSSVFGNFIAAALARWLNNRSAIAILCVTYFLSLFLTYRQPLPHQTLWYGLAFCGISQGLFGLFTMYLPPLFPTLLRSTGAGFCYNIGRIAAGFGTVFFGLFAKDVDVGNSLFYASFLFLPAAAIALLLPISDDDKRPETT